MCSGRWNNTPRELQMKKIILFISLAGCLASIFFFRTEVVEMLAPKVADYFGVEIEKLSINQLQLNKISLQELVAKYEDNNTHALIAMRDVVVNSDPNIEGRNQIKNISMAEMLITVKEIDSKKSDKDQTINELLKQIPLFKIDVKRLIVNYVSLDGSVVSYKGGLYIGEYL